MAKMYLCRHPGCNQAIPVMGYCDKHRSEHERKREDFKQRQVSQEVTWRKIYSSPRWRRERAEFLRINPFCIYCGQPANAVHHSIPHRGDERIFWDQRYWEPICTSCHSKITYREIAQRVGRGNAAV